MKLTATQIVFLEKYLDATKICPSQSSGSVSDGKTPATLPVWRDAMETVGQQIANLERELRNSSQPMAVRIAEFGLNGITGTQLTSLQVALMQLDRSEDGAHVKSRVRVDTAIKKLRSFLTSNSVLPLLEKNPFSAPVTVRATLTRALDEIELRMTR